MAYPSVTIGGVAITQARLVSVSVSQTLNQHSWAVISCAQTDDEPIPVEQWLGRPLVVTSVDDTGATCHHFSGLVLTSKLVYESSGTYSAVITGVSKTWLLDQAMRKQYYPEQGLSAVASSIASQAGLKASVNVPDGKPLNYVQYGETDFSLLYRIVDDHNAWLRPSDTGIEIFNSFQAGSTLSWRGVSGLGLLHFELSGTVKPASFDGAHYDFHTMASQNFTKVAKAPSFYMSQSAMAGSVQQESTAVMPSGFAQQRARVMTLEEYRQSLEDESERSVGSAVVGTGASRNQALLAGNTVTLTGSMPAAGTYGLTKVVHRWTSAGYSNEFTCTPWKQYRNAEEPALRSWNGVVPARVVDHNDPGKMGRIKVQFFWQDAGSTHWARAASPHAGPGRGFMFLPEVGDEVAVAFEDGDPERPMILGSLWNGVQQAPRDEFRGADIANNDVKRFISKAGNRMQISDLPGKETVLFATPHSTRMVMTEEADETGRTLVLLESAGDIILSAPKGRVHIQSQFFSREIGVPNPPGQAAAAPAAKAPASAAPKPAAAAAPLNSDTKQQRIKALTDAQNAARNDPANQPTRDAKGRLTTHCNSATTHTVEATGAPTGPFVGSNGQPLMANQVSKNLATSTDYKEVSPDEAQAYANDGGTAVGAYDNPVPGHHGHLVTLRPDGVAGDPADSGTGPLWNNVGTNVGVQNAGSGTAASAMKYYIPSGGGGGN